MKPSVTKTPIPAAEKRATLRPMGRIASGFTERARPENVVPLPIVAPWRQGHVIAGRYQLDRLLAEGGMGEVWCAVDRALDRKVAIKTMRCEPSPAHESRLFEEARVTALVRHPATVMALDVGHDGSRPFFVMELLEGETLRQLLRRQQRLGRHRALRLVATLANALSLFHAQGIVHRDLKPSNVFLAREGPGIQPKLLDFGIAHDDRELAWADMKVIGTPRYMSPEQLGRLPVDGGADIWSLTVVLYECIAGFPPFEGATASEVVARQEEGPPAWPPGVDEGLWAVILQGLENERCDRFATMQELEEALEDLLR